MDINTIIKKAVENFMSYRDNAEKYAGYVPTLVTVNHPITVEDFVALVKKVSSYDVFTSYIDNYKQQKQAEAANDRLEEEFNAILAKYDIKPVNLYSIADKRGTVYSRLHTSEEAVAEYINKLFKEEDIMETKAQEVVERNNEIKKLQEVLMMNGTKTERMVKVLELCDTVKKVQEDGYVNKATLAQFLFDTDIVGRRLSGSEFKRTKRDTLIDTLRTAVNNLTNAEVVTSVAPVEVEVVEVGDLPQTADTRLVIDDTIIEKPVQVVTEVKEVKTMDAKEMTSILMHKIGDMAIANRKKGFGTTISAYMLCAYILDVKYGIKRLKGHESEVTDEMKQTVRDVRSWLIKNGYIQTAVFKDSKRTFFVPGVYDGNNAEKLFNAANVPHEEKIETVSYRITKKMNEWYK